MGSVLTIIIAVSHQADSSRRMNMMTLLEVRKRLATLLAVVVALVLVGCAGTSSESESSSSSGERTPCSECEAKCEGADNVVDCREKCLRDCTP